MDDYCTVENIIRNCNKVFTPFNFIQFSPGDIVFIAPHYIYYLRLHYGENIPSCHDVTFVTVGFDYPIESMISKNDFELIINNLNLKEWIVDYTFLDHYKLRRIICIYESIYENHNNNFIQCNSILDIGKIVASNGIPVIRVPYKIDNICYLSPPGYLKYYYSSSDDPVVKESIFSLPDESIKNCIDILKIPKDLKQYKMTVEESFEILNIIKKHIKSLGIRFRSRPWNGEIYYINILDKDKLINE